LVFKPLTHWLSGQYFYKKFAKVTQELPEILRKLRVIKNWSQEYVAEEIKVDISTYSRYEKGETSIKFDVVVKIAQLYKMTLDELYHYGDPTFNVSEPSESYRIRRKISVIVELDGIEDNLNQWIVKLQKLNAAI
jgi:transcriptional regulator with XRE-family HTH domain